MVLTLALEKAQPINLSFAVESPGFLKEQIRMICHLTLPSCNKDFLTPTCQN